MLNSFHKISEMKINIEDKITIIESKPYSIAIVFVECEKKSE